MRQPHRYVSEEIVTCKRCQTPDLHWVQMANAQWRLFDSKDYIHRCKGGIPK